MNAPIYFKRATKWQTAGLCLFGLNTLISFGLIFTKNTKFEPFLAWSLCVLVIGSVFVSLWSRYLINNGNTAQRTAQFADAFGVACDHPVRNGYYNTSLQPGLRRLLATTCECAGLTKEILLEMFTVHLFKVVGFGMIFLTYVTYWKTDASIVAVAAQTLFSGNLLGTLVEMIRYTQKVQRTEQALVNIFRTSADLDDPHTMAIGIAAHVDYECAKEEAAILLDSKIYERLNPSYTERWSRLRIEFKIDV